MNATKSCLYRILAFLCLALPLGVYAQQKPAFKLFFEKAYLHTDRDVYTQGDTIWFKAYLVNGQSNAPIGTSGNLYVELIQADSAKIMTREIIRLENGKGNGDIKLTDTIPSGEYTLRAYTNWMRNFGDDFVFEKRIVVYNTETVNKAVRTIPAVADKEHKSGKVEHQPVARPNINLSFYPESGSMVEGLNSIVAIKAQDAMGKGLAVHGAVLNASGDTVTHFSCDSLGMGMLSLLPLAGQRYNAEFSWKGTNYTAELPQALTKGLAMRVNSNDTVINVILSANDTLRHQLTLMGRHGGKVFLERSFTLAKQAVLKIPKSMYPEGIAALTLYDEQNKPNCERLVYIHGQKTVNLNIATDKPTYQPKGKVTVKLKLSDTSATANLSIAVVDESLVPLQQGNIVNYLLLTSELKGDIAHPERYFDSTNINRVKQLDLLLMTQGWRDFLWRRVADSAIRITYAVENGIDIAGKVKNERNDKPLPGLNITMHASAARGIKLFSDVTDSLGRFSFRGLEYYGNGPVELSATDAKGEKKGTFYIDTLGSLPVKRQINAILDTTATIVTALEKRREALKIVNFKGINQLKEVKIKSSKTIVLGNGNPYTIWGADQVFEITPKDHKYKTLEWWLLHNVKGARQSREIPPPPSSGKRPITGVVFDGIGVGMYMPPGTNILISRGVDTLIPPEFFVNGRELYTKPDMDGNDTEADVYRSTYYPLAINKFKRIVARHVTGVDPDHPGVMIDHYLLYLTIDDDALAGYNQGVLTANITGYYNARTFYKPFYDTPKSQTKPDYRTTIHWEPNITMGKSGEATVTYYNADPKTNVRVVVEGVTSKGEPLVGTTVYTIK